MSGKNREKSGNFEVDDNWQPCLWIYQLQAEFILCKGGLGQFKMGALAICQDTCSVLFIAQTLIQ